MPVSSSSLTTIVDDSDPVLGELSEVPAAPAGLLACLAKVTDPRKRRGVRGTPDVVVGQFRPGSDGHNPPRVSIAIEINASGL
jgi:hypothetical protein